MPTDRQLNANRENAAHSTGPQTPEGKQRSARNSSKHGLTGSQIVVPGESPEDYDRLTTQMLEEWHPANLDEEQLVLQIASSWWRLQRAYRIESASLTLDTQAYTCADTIDMAVSNALWNNLPRYDILRRYIGSIERAWNRAKDELRRIQAERRKPDLSSKPLKSQPISKIGFVSSPDCSPLSEPAARALRTPPQALATANLPVPKRL